MELLKPTGEKVNVPKERYSVEYKILKDELNNPTSRKDKFLSLVRSEVDPSQIPTTQIEKRALREFNVESGPYWKPFIMYEIQGQLASGARLSYEQIAKNILEKEDSIYGSDFLKFKLSLLGGLLVLTEQNVLQRNREDGKWLYSLVSIRDATAKIEKLTDAFMRLSRGQTLKEKILC